jgi:hypothetical protein
MSDPFSIDQVEQALRNAHMAGDKESAGKIAQRLQEMKQAQTTRSREQASSGATLRFGPWDTGIGIPQWMDEGIAGAGRRAMDIVTLGNNPMRDEASDRNLDASTAATVGSVLADVGTLAGGGSALRAASTVPQIARGAPALANAMRATGQAMFAPKSVPTAAAVGGGYSAATTPGSIDDRAVAGAIGVAAGAGGQMLPRMFASRIHNEVSPDVADLAARGVRMTPGQIAGGAWNTAEQKAQSLPIVGDFIKKSRVQSLQDFEVAAYNEALKPVKRMVTGGGREAAKSAYDQMDAVYSKITPKLRIGSDIDIQQRLVQIKDSLDDSYARKFEKFMAERFGGKFDPQDGLTGDNFKAVESEIKAKAREFLSSADPAQREYGTALKAARDAMIDVARKYSPKRAIDELAKADLAYARLERVAGAAGMVGAKGGHFTPSQMLNQVQRKEGSRLAFRKGEALMQDLAERADPILSTTVPNSGTVDRLLLNAGAVGGLGFLDPLTATAYGVGSLAFTEPARQIAQSAMLKQSASPAARGVANAMRLAAPYTAGVGMMFAPTIYAGK